MRTCRLEAHNGSFALSLKYIWWCQFLFKASSAGHPGLVTAVWRPSQESRFIRVTLLLQLLLSYHSLSVLVDCFNSFPDMCIFVWIAEPQTSLTPNEPYCKSMCPAASCSRRGCTLPDQCDRRFSEPRSPWGVGKEHVKDSRLTF